MGTHQISYFSHNINRYLLTLNADSPYVPSLEIILCTIAHTGRGIIYSFIGQIVNWEIVSDWIYSKNSLGASATPLLISQNNY